MLKRNIVIILVKALADDIEDIVMKSQLFRIQDLDFLSFYDVSTQLFLVHNVALMWLMVGLRIRNIVHFSIPPISYHGIAFTPCLRVSLWLSKIIILRDGMN